MSGQLPKNGTRRPASGTINPSGRGPTDRRDRSAGALDDLAVFIHVARHASFVEASRRLAIPTSSVSRAVARLEEALGAQLLRRTSRRVALTDEGSQLVAHAAPHLEGLDEALASAADRRAEPAGVVRVTAPAYTGATRVARALARFARAHPKISIELDATNTIRDLIQDRFDFAVRVGAHADPDFIARRIWQGTFGIFAARDFVESALGGRARIGREALERVPCVAMRTQAIWRFVRPGGQSVEIAPRVRFAVNDPRAAVEAARQGIGLVLAPRDGMAGRGDPPLVRVRTDFGEPEPIDLYVVYPTRRLLPQRVRMVIEWLARATTAP
jgi:DNA-binding transcriptional LysR family regulator